LNVLFLGDGSVSNIAGYISNYITATGYSITYSAVTMGTTYTGGGNITPDNYDVVVIYKEGKCSRKFYLLFTRIFFYQFLKFSKIGNYKTEV
jgi:hypothetical protein